MSAPFVAENDLEAYCYLKHALQPRWRVESYPSTDYYSEWTFHYEVCEDDHVLHVLRGDFRDLEPGALAERARRIVAELRTGPEPGTAAGQEVTR